MIEGTVRQSLSNRGSNVTTYGREAVDHVLLIAAVDELTT